MVGHLGGPKVNMYVGVVVVVGADTSEVIPYVQASFWMYFPKWYESGCKSSNIIVSVLISSNVRCF